MIWKAFMEKVPEDGSKSFNSPPYLGGASTWVVRRDGKWQLDNGYCRGSRLVAYFSGEGPDGEADCKPNEVSVPLVLGMTEAGAEATLAAQPLGAKVVYRPAKAGALPGLVVDQDPRRGGLSANDEVTVVVSKARFGMLPNSSARARGRPARGGPSRDQAPSETAPDRRRGSSGSRRRRVAIAPGMRQARGRGRLTNVEPASE